jgi:hypothetical protein
MVLINGYTETGEFEYDTNLILNLPHVKNLSYDYEIPLIESVPGTPRSMSKIIRISEKESL